MGPESYTSACALVHVQQHIAFYITWSIVKIAIQFL